MIVLGRQVLSCFVRIFVTEAVMGIHWPFLTMLS